MYRGENSLKRLFCSQINIPNKVFKTCVKSNVAITRKFDNEIQGSTVTAIAKCQFEPHVDESFEVEKDLRDSLIWFGQQR